MQQPNVKTLAEAKKLVSDQNLSHAKNITARKTLKYAPNQGDSTNQKTTNSRLIRIGTNPPQKK